MAWTGSTQEKPAHQPASNFRWSISPRQLHWKDERAGCECAFTEDFLYYEGRSVLVKSCMHTIPFHISQANCQHRLPWRNFAYFFGKTPENDLLKLANLSNFMISFISQVFVFSNFFLNNICDNVISSCWAGGQDGRNFWLQAMLLVG